VPNSPWFTVIVAVSVFSTIPTRAASQQSDADYARGQQAGYNACKTVCRPTVPIGNQTSTSYGFGWNAGCIQAGGPTAACSQTTNPGGGGTAKPPIDPTPAVETGKTLYDSGIIDGYVGCMSGANLNRTLTVPDEFPHRTPYANGYYDGCLRGLGEWERKNPTKTVPVLHLPSEGKSGQENYDRGRRVGAYACDKSRKLDYQVRADVSGKDFTRGFQDACAAQPLLEQADLLYVDAGNSADRANGLTIAAQNKAKDAPAQRAQSYIQLSQLGKDLNAEGKRLRDEAMKLRRSPNPTQQDLLSLQNRVRDYVQRVKDGEAKYYALNNAPESPVQEPVVQRVPASGDEPHVTAQEAAAYLRAHPELAGKAQDIIRTMQAAHKSDKEIEVAVRRFVAESQAADRDRSNGQQNANQNQEVPQMNSEELKQFIAENPELKRQMQDYATDLQRQGKSKDEVLRAVYQRLNEVHAERVRQLAQAQAPRQFRSHDVNGVNSANVGRLDSRNVERTQSADVQPQGSESVSAYRGNDIQPQRAENVRRYRSNSVRKDRAQSVRETRADDVQQVRAEDVQEYRAQDVQQNKAQGVKRYRASDVTPYQAEDVKPYQAEDVRSVEAQVPKQSRRQDVEPYGAENPSKPPREIEPDPSIYPRKQNSNGAGSQFIHTFGLAVPGVVYSYDNYAANTRTTVTATGAVTNSAIRINPDHTYDWNSAWDGKMIHGRWTDWDGGIRIERGQEGKDWLMHALKPASGKATVVLYNDSTQYHGTPLD